MKTIARPVAAARSPRFEHDCEDCKFLGRTDKVDFYHCERENCFVARRSSEPSQYGSLPAALSPFPPGSVYSLAEKIFQAKVEPKVYKIVSV